MLFLNLIYLFSDIIGFAPSGRGGGQRKLFKKSGKSL
jgi:hypothetical protein